MDNPENLSAEELDQRKEEMKGMYIPEHKDET